jgi:hypothetical protein
MWREAYHSFSLAFSLKYLRMASVFWQWPCSVLESAPANTTVPNLESSISLTSSMLKAAEALEMQQGTIIDNLSYQLTAIICF